MKSRSIMIIIVASFVLLPAIPSAHAEVATSDEARDVAERWVTLIIQQTGGWGGAQSAEVAETREFRRAARLLGYFFPLKPRGFIVVSLYKELAPVKAYSEASNLDPDSDQGPADIIKGGMERILKSIEAQIGPIESVRSEELNEILEINYRQVWDELEGDFCNLGYEQGGILLSSEWHQDDPYNRQCPAGHNGCAQDHCDVGCVAIAGSQIMRYWNWPPYGEGAPYDDLYDWPNMPDQFWSLSDQAEIDAVAELCHEVGLASDMDYCFSDDPELLCASGTPTSAMVDVYEDVYRYSTECAIQYRVNYNAAEWFDLIENQISQSRPAQYRIPGHSIVCDGWRVVGGENQYHINYGWGGGHSEWYAVDAIYGGDPDSEYMIVNIFPETSLGSSVDGVYDPWPFTFLYLDQDATCSEYARFTANLQFLPGVSLNCTSSTGDLEFIGWNRLFSRGDMSKGIRIKHSGSMRVSQHGGVKFY